MKSDKLKPWCLFAVLAVLLSPCPVRAAGTPSDRELANITFDQNLGSNISLSLPFADENGRKVNLGNYFKEKPVILVLGYYGCPMLCNLVMNGMIESLEDLKWTIGREFDVVNISIDPQETPELATAKKRSYLKRYGRGGAGEGWHFLTGRETEIRIVAREAGFNYLYDPATHHYAHPSGIVFLSPKGRIVGYQFGVVFEPRAVLANLQRAGTGQPGSPIQKLVFLCFHYNPLQGKYGPTIMFILRMMAGFTILALIGGVIVAAKKQKSKSAPLVPNPAVRGEAAP